MAPESASQGEGRDAEITCRRDAVREESALSLTAQTELTRAPFSHASLIIVCLFNSHSPHLPPSPSPPPTLHDSSCMHPAGPRGPQRHPSLTGSILTRVPSDGGLRQESRHASSRLCWHRPPLPSTKSFYRLRNRMSASGASMALPELLSACDAFFPLS